MTRQLTGPLAALAAAALVVGCGYTTGFDLAEQGVRTVGVRVVGNETYRQDLERPLTRQLIEALPLHTGLSVTSPARADAVLAVDLVQVKGLSLLQGGENPVLEGALRFEVEVELRDRRTDLLLRTARITDVGEFRSPIGETEASATREIAMDLARKIALALEPGF